MPPDGPAYLVRFPYRANPLANAGVGFVVTERCILTCAHVVNLALGRDRRAQQMPDGTDEVYLRFPRAEDSIRSARVQRWEPPPAGGARGGDIAGLVITGEEGLPAGVTPARFTLEPAAEVRLFGYPLGRPDGVWADGRVRGEVGGGLLQLDPTGDSVWRAQPGFSGTPVVVPNGQVIGMFKAAGPDDEHPDGYATPARLLREAWPDVVTVLPPNPYRGLATFTAADAELFLGRATETRQLVDAVQRNPFVLVIGPSGVGKSSLVQAGLLPALDREKWVSVTCRPSDHHDDPFQALAAAVRRAEGVTGPDIDTRRTRTREIREHGLASLAAELRLGSGKRTLLVVDQLEELFRVEDAGVVAHFLDRLLELPETMPEEHPAVVVATLRADFYHRVLDHPDAAPRLAGREVTLSPLGAAALREVIEIPACRSGGVTFDDHLVDRIVTDATTGTGALPLLEFTLETLWEHQSGGRIGHRAYGEIGAVVGSLDQRGEDTAGELLRSGVSDRDIERTLVALVGSSHREDTPATRRTCPAAELDPTQRRVAETLTRARLLTAALRDGQACYELAHEALIGSWERLRRAAEADGEFLRWRTKMEQWDERDGLLPEAWVAEGTYWCAERDDVPARLVDLVRRNRDELQRRVGELERAHRRAEALRLAAQAQMELIRAAGLTAALPLAAESLALDHTFAGDSVARAALHLAARPLSRLAHDGPVWSVVFSPDGAWVGTGSGDGTARVFDA